MAKNAKKTKRNASAVPASVMLQLQQECTRKLADELIRVMDGEVSGAMVITCTPDGSISVNTAGCLRSNSTLHTSIALGVLGRLISSGVLPEAWTYSTAGHHP